MLYAITFIALVAIAITSYILEGYELLSPSMMACISMCMCVLLAIVGLGTWNIVDLGPTVAASVIIGTAMFSVGSAIARQLFYKKGNIKQYMNNNVINNRITMSPWSIWALIAIMAIIGAMHISQMEALAKEMNIPYNGIIDLGRQLREITNSVFSNDTSGFDAGFPLWDRGLTKVRTAFNYIAAGLLAYEIYQQNRGIGLIASIVFFIEACVLSLIEGGRSGALMYCVACITVFWLLCVNNDGQNGAKHSFRVVTKMSKKFFSWGIVLGAIVMILFYFSGSLVGRSAKGGVLGYLSFYLGCGLPSFQSLLDSGTTPYNIPGFNTFHEQLLFLSKFGLINNLPGYGSYFVRLGDYSSNVFTFAYRYYADFGLAGVGILSAITGFCYGTMYRTARAAFNHSFTYGFIFSVLYARVGCQLIDICRDEKFFATFLTPNNILIMLIMAVTMILITECSSVKKKKTTIYYCS